MHLRGIGFASAAALIFGLGVVLARFLGGAIDATLVALLCLGAGGLLLTGWLALTGTSLFATLAAFMRRDWLDLVLLAFVGTALPLLCVVVGLPQTSAVTGGFLLQLNGVAALLFAVVLLGERIRFRQGMGIVLLLLGSALIVLKGGAGGGLGGGSATGDLLIVIGALGLGFGLIPAKRLAARADTLPLTALRLVVGALTVVPVVAVELIVARQTGQALLWRPSLATLLWILPLYIVTNFCLAYLSQQEGLRLLNAWEVAAINQATPLFTTVFALFILGERMTVVQAIGGLAALVGGLVVSLPEPRATKASSAPEQR